MTKEEKWPERGEIVIGNVVKVNPYSAFVSLEEYGNREGMIHISEIAGKWVRDIRKFVKVGEKVVAKVMYVDRDRNQITLSLKRVRAFDTQSKMKEYKKGIKAEKMLKLLSDRLNLSIDKVKLEIVNDIEEKVGSVFDAFQMSMTPQGYDLLIRKGIKEDIAKAIKAIAEENLKIKETGIRKIVEISCYGPDGMNMIKNVLVDAKKAYDIDIKYVSAPKYSLTLKTKNAKSGERKVKEASEYIIEKIQQLGGEGKVE